MSHLLDTPVSSDHDTFTYTRRMLLHAYNDTMMQNPAHSDQYSANGMILPTSWCA